MRGKRWRPGYDGLTRAERKGGVYRAYLPDTLSDRRWLLDGETAADMSDAERAVIELNVSVKALRNTEALARLVLRAEALSSSRIEGLVVGPRRILKAELAQETNDMTALEVLNNIRAMDSALALAVERPVTVETFQEIHSRLLAGTRLSDYAGVVRTQQNWIGGTYVNPIGAAYVPPPPEAVPELLEDLAAFCNSDDLSPLAQAAMAHAQFETIHPFVDGNGRVGRALIHLVLRRRGLCPSVAPPISLALATRSADYVKALGAFRHVGESSSPEAVEGANDWLSFFCSCTLHACRNAAAFEERIGQVKQGWLDDVGAQATPAVRELVEALVGRPLFTAASMKQVLGRSMPTVNEAISRLEAAGAVKQVNAGKRNRAFEAVGVIEAFTSLERNLASIADDTAVSKPSRPVPFLHETVHV